MSMYLGLVGSDHVDLTASNHVVDEDHRALSYLVNVFIVLEIYMSIIDYNY